MKPKVARACSCCDCSLVTPERKNQVSKHQKVVLLQLSGKQAIISVCVSCQVTPQNLPEIWHRQVLLQMQSQTEKRISAIHKLEQDIPVGVLYAFDRETA